MGLLTATTTKLPRHSSPQSTPRYTLPVLLHLNPFRHCPVGSRPRQSCVTESERERVTESEHMSERESEREREREREHMSEREREREHESESERESREETEYI